MLCGAMNAKVKFENKKIKLFYQDQDLELDQGLGKEQKIIKRFDEMKFFNLVPDYMKPILIFKSHELEVNSNFKLKR